MSKAKKPIMIILFVIMLLLLTGVCSMVYGSVYLPFSRIIDALHGSDRTAAIILFNLRLPRLLGSLLAGVGLSTAGMLLQTVTNNDLCSPSIIGVNAGAGFFVMLLLCLFPMLWRWLPIASFIGAIIVTVLVLSIAHLGSRWEQKATLILAGVALSSLLNAGIAFLSLKYPDVLTSYTAFSVGGFSGLRLNQLTVPAITILLCLLVAMLTAPKIRLLCLGDELASSLGVNIRFLRTLTVVLASALCAAVVSFAGLLGFAGLIVPHIVRRIFNGSLRTQLLLCMLFGALIVSVSDLIGRTLFSPWELPAGIIMAFVGAPFFIYLIIGRRKHYD